MIDVLFGLPLVRSTIQYSQYSFAKQLGYCALVVVDCVVAALLQDKQKYCTLRSTVLYKYHVLTVLDYVEVNALPCCCSLLVRVPYR